MLMATSCTYSIVTTSSSGMDMSVCVRSLLSAFSYMSEMSCTNVKVKHEQADGDLLSCRSSLRD